MTEHCEHEKLIIENHHKEFEKEIFEYKASTCKDCNAVLWDNELEKSYGAWVNKLYKEKRHIFQIQYSIPATVQECIGKLLERFPHVEESLLIRALIVVYIDMVENEQNIMDSLEHYLISEDYLHLIEGQKNSKKIQFAPSGFQKIQSYSKLFGMKPNKILEEVLNRMILLSIREDEVMKEFWENVILKDIAMIIEAA